MPLHAMHPLAFIFICACLCTHSGKHMQGGCKGWKQRCSSVSLSNRRDSSAYSAFTCFHYHLCTHLGRHMQGDCKGWKQRCSGVRPYATKQLQERSSSSR
eukprot:scaffold286905_cov22-Tisochrysis_lutea.AAC.1